MLILDSAPPAKVGGKPKRRIQNLSWIQQLGLEDAVRHTPPPKSSTAKKGLGFETRVGELLRKMESEGSISNLLLKPWFRFVDRNGYGLAQPDMLFEVTLPDSSEVLHVVCECKLTETSDAWQQLTDLYIPIIKAVNQTENVTGLQIVRNIRSRDVEFFSEFEDFVPCGTWFLPTT